MAMNSELERHIRAAEEAGKPEGANALRGLQTTFNSLVQSGIVNELPLNVQYSVTEQTLESDDPERPELFTNKEGFQLAITKKDLEDPSHLRPLLEFFLLPYHRPHSPLVTGTIHGILRYTQDYGTPKHEFVRTNNLAGLLGMTSEELGLIYSIGVERSALLIEALQPLRDRFYPKQPKT